MGSPRPRLSMCSISQHCQTSWPPGAGHDVEDTDFADFSQRVRQPLCNWLSVALHTGGSPSFQDKSKVGWTFTKDAFHVGYSLFTGALVAGVICLASPSYSRSEGLLLLWRESANLALCSCNRARCGLMVHPSFAALGRRWPSSDRRRQFSVRRCLQAGDILRTWSRIAS